MNKQQQARARALKQIADAHTDWNLNHADDAPFFPEDSKPHEGVKPEESDYSALSLDRSATSEQESELWKAQAKGRAALEKLRNT
jgi:hypothetical protein